MPIQSVSSVSTGAAAAFFSAAASRINSNVAAQGDIVLQTTNLTPRANGPQVGLAETPVRFSGNIVDLRT